VGRIARQHLISSRNVGLSGPGDVFLRKFEFHGGAHSHGRTLTAFDVKAEFSFQVDEGRALSFPLLLDNANNFWVTAR
jgi:hypothetical protein